MNLFNRSYEKLEDERKKKEERKEGLKQLKEENLSNKDIFALIISMFQLILPLVLIVLIVYFIIIFVFVKI